MLCCLGGNVCPNGYTELELLLDLKDRERSGPSAIHLDELKSCYQVECLPWLRCWGQVWFQLLCRLKKGFWLALFEEAISFTVDSTAETPPQNPTESNGPSTSESVRTSTASSSLVNSPNTQRGELEALQTQNKATLLPMHAHHTLPTSSSHDRTL